MKALTLCAALLGALLMPQTATAERYRIDPVHSVVVFRVTHFNVGAFYGLFRKVSGHFVVDGRRSSVEIKVAAASVFTANRKRDTHIKSPDFLNVKQFPSITFKSTKVRPAGRTFVVRGKLTLHGVTRAVKVKMRRIGAGKDAWGKYRSGFEGKLTINRSVYGMKKMKGAVGDKITLTIAVEGIRK